MARRTSWRNEPSPEKVVFHGRRRTNEEFFQGCVIGVIVLILLALPLVTAAARRLRLPSRHLPRPPTTATNTPAPTATPSPTRSLCDNTPVPGATATPVPTATPVRRYSYTYSRPTATPAPTATAALQRLRRQAGHRNPYGLPYPMTGPQRPTVP